MSLETITVEEAFRLRDTEIEIQKQIAWLQHNFDWEEMKEVYQYVTSRLGLDNEIANPYIRILDDMLKDRLLLHSRKSLHY